MGSLRHSPRTRARVIKEFKRVGRIDLACAAAGVDRSCHYGWLKNDPEYEKEFAAALPEANGLLRDEAIRRAYHGTMRPVAVAGQVMMVTEFSDRLMEFLLKSHDPATYGDRKELTHKGDLTVKRLIGVSEDDI